jgi:hypothetical protein
MSLLILSGMQLKQARKEGRLAEALLDRRAKLKRYVRRAETIFPYPD